MQAQPHRRSSPPPCPRPRERRREARQPTRLVVDLEAADGLQFVGTTLDLSLGGMCLEIGAPLAPGDRVRLHLRLPGEAGVITSEGLVRWVRELAGGSGIVGLSLPPLPTRELYLLRAFLDAAAGAAASASGGEPTPQPGGAARATLK